MFEFDWDPAKARKNLHDHGISFDEAISVFSDDQAILEDDPDHSINEHRFLLIGMSATLRLLVVVHCYQRAAEVIELISARKATRSERAQYGARWLK